MVIDRLATHPTTRIETLTKVSRGPVAAQWARNINQYRGDGLRQMGTVVVRNPTANKLSATRFRVAACVDVVQVTAASQDARCRDQILGRLAHATSDGLFDK